MTTIPFAQAKARLSALVDRVEAGETVEITRHGRAVAKLVPSEPPREPFDWAALDAFIATLPPQPDSGEFVSAMRDEDAH